MKLKKSTLRVILVTAPAKEAESLARTLLEERLIACANLIPKVTSLYWWDGKIERGAETLIVMKTPRTLTRKLFARLKKLHSYAVPEFLALAPVESNPDYEAWAVNSVSRSPSR